MNASDTKLKFFCIRRTLPIAADAQSLFTSLTDGGTTTGAVLLQSSDNIPRYGERSLAAVGASLRISGRDEVYRIEALDDRGRILIPILTARLKSFSAELSPILAATGDAVGIAGRIDIDRRSVSGRERPLRRNAMDVLRQVAFLAPDEDRSDVPSHGCFGAFAYTFVHQYERFERNPREVLDEPDYVFFLATRLFVIDHAGSATHLASSVPVIPGADLAPLLNEAEADVRRMIAAAAPPAATAPAPACGRTWRFGNVESDVDRETYCANVVRIQRDIEAGRAYQVVYGRRLSAPFEGSPLDVYARLSRTNPSPYMFYINDGDGVLLAASPEMAVRAEPGSTGTVVELRPIAGTKPRGFIDGRLDPLTDVKYETALKIDPKELAEHTMLVDLARNDLASICRPGTTQVTDPFVVEKYSHVQHLVSSVSGVLREPLDGLHAYLATMNMGTVTGAPKLEAMKIINTLEASGRGFFGGAAGYLFPDGRLDTALIIRAVRFKRGQAHIRAAAGIVADSVPESEWTETENKAAAAIRALRGTVDASSEDAA